jgi:hypothetical protein
MQSGGKMTLDGGNHHIPPLPQSHTQLLDVAREKLAVLNDLVDDHLRKDPGVEIGPSFGAAWLRANAINRDRIAFA